MCSCACSGVLSYYLGGNRGGGGFQGSGNEKHAEIHDYPGVIFYFSGRQVSCFMIVKKLCLLQIIFHQHLCHKFNMTANTVEFWHEE